MAPGAWHRDLEGRDCLSRYAGVSLTVKLGSPGLSVSPQGDRSPGRQGRPRLTRWALKPAASSFSDSPISQVLSPRLVHK